MNDEEIIKNSNWKTPYFKIKDEYWDAGARGELTFLKRHLGGWLARHELPKLLQQAREDERVKVAEDIFSKLKKLEYRTPAYVEGNPHIALEMVGYLNLQKKYLKPKGADEKVKP